MVKKTSDERKKTNGRGAELHDEFIRELKLLRSQAREVCENFMLRREGHIETIISSISLVNRKKLKELLPSWLHEIQSLKLKPHKGRLKDLKEIDRIISTLQDIVIDASGKAGEQKNTRRTGAAKLAEAHQKEQSIT